MAEPPVMPTPTPSTAPHAQAEAETSREVVGLFTEARQLEAAVQDLLTNGFDHADLAVLANERTVRHKLGHRIEDANAAADDPTVPRKNWVEPESRTEWRGALAAMLGYVGAVTAVALTFASGGAAAAGIAAALVGAGGGAGIGAGLSRFLDHRLARELERQVEAGGILLWIGCRDADCEPRAQAIMTRHGAVNVHGHSIGWI